MYNGQKIKNEGQTICTRHAYVQWSEDKERRTNNMYKAYLCTMIRRLGTKDKQGSTKCLVHIVCPSFFIFWSLYIGMPCTYCLSFVLCLLIIVHRQTICTRHTYVQWSEDKERRTNNMYKAYLCTMIRRQRTKDKQYVVHRYALYILFVLRSLPSDHCT
jgi:mannose/fructose/N-acetylgalactosamine-specific phosphotransferase system component IID